MFASVSFFSQFGLGLLFLPFLRKELREHFMAFFLSVFRARSKGEVVNKKGEGTFRDAH